uniref:Cardiotrophin-like cytokine factor 1 n=1 Tax=Sinocyclocheilus anshuiensis TaxID=1608454 RepID=A0A671NHH8_9TELE
VPNPDPGFSPPRPNSSSLSVPSAATRVDLWRGLENGARLAQNQRAYSVLLCAVRELAHSTLCPYLQSSLLHFCSGLSGLLGSISGLMNALGYTSLPASTPAHGYAPLLSSQFQGVEGFWVLRELQSWLWRSAKDFTRLKKRLRQYLATLHLN